MQKQKEYLTRTCSQGACAILCLFLGISSAYSQKNLGYLNSDGNQHTISYLDEQYQDATIPGNARGYLLLRAYGADGGYKKMSSSTKSDKKIDAGRGALVEAYFKIGTGQGEIPPNSTIRFIVGGRGESVSSGISSGGGGGGGTGIAYEKLKVDNTTKSIPDPRNGGAFPQMSTGDKWKVLMIAGGGGGGRGDCCASGTTGSPGRAYTPDQVLNDEHPEFSMLGCPQGDGDSQSVNRSGGSLYSCDSLTDGQKYNVIGEVTGIEWFTWEEDTKFAHAGWPNGPFSNEPVGNSPHHKTDWTHGGWGIGPGGEGRDKQSKSGGGGGYYGGHKSDGGHAQGGASYVYGYLTSEKIMGIITKYDLEDEIKAYALAYKQEKMSQVQAKFPQAKAPQNKLGQSNEIDVKELVEKAVAANALKITGIYSVERGKTDSPTHGSVVYQFVDKPSSGQQIRSLSNQSKCLDLKDEKAANGTSIMLSNCSSSADRQQWRFVSHAITSELNSSKCMYLDGGHHENGRSIQIYDCKSDVAQRWVYDGISKQIRYLHMWTKCIKPASNGAMQIWDCADMPEQQWAIDGAITAEGDTWIKTVHLAKDETKCLDLLDRNTSNGHNIQLSQCDDNDDAQKWLFDGTFIRYNAQQGKCVDIKDRNTQNGTNIQLWDCNDDGAQQWVYDGITGTIRYLKDPDKCLVTTGGSTATGANIEIRDCNDSPAQQWVIKGAKTSFGPDKIVSIHRSVDDGKSVDVSAGGTADGTNIQLWRYSVGNVNNQWTYDGMYFRFKKDPTKCLDLKNGSTSDKNNIQLWHCNGGRAQRWLYDATSKSIRLADHWKKCVDLRDDNNDDGTNIWIYECKNNNAQKWVIK